MQLKTVLFAVLLTVCGTAYANDKVIDPKTDLGGSVVHAETRKPLKDVTVTAYLSSKKEKTVFTDASGSFSFDNLRPGSYRFVFEKDGYRKVSKEKTITRPDEALGLEVLLDEQEHFEFLPGLLLDFQK
mgnify:CR=1 FL=1